MSNVIRIHLDENCDPRIAAGLRYRGIEVTTTLEANLVAASDEEQLEFARVGNRVIFTGDADFIRLHAAGVPHRGIIYSPMGRQSIGEIITGILLISRVYDQDEMIGRLEFI